VRARKRFGQHFLEPAWIQKVVAAFEPRAGDVVLEIGPGRGQLTIPLAARVARVVAVEIDRDLAAALAARAPANVTIVNADILSADVASLLPPPGEDGRLRVAGNLPYNISSPILFALIEARRSEPRLLDATVMLQQEVADRLAAPPGTRDYGVLTVSVARFARVVPLLKLPPGAFRPPPKVSSALVRLEFIDPAHAGLAPPWFDDMVRALFAQRRKTLSNGLRAFARSRGLDATDALERAGIDGRRRPETLTVEELLALAGALGD
jgi:16S rRNA (adenine1518-N6/adenine1519-N6)-dimethyltransferase